MEEATPEKSAGDLAFEAELSGDDQQEVSYVNGQGWQLKNYHPNPNVRNNQQLFWPKQDKPTDPAQSNQGQYVGYQKNYQPRAYVLSQPQNNTPQMQKHQNPQPATSAPIVALQDETKVMLQLLLQGQQLQGKALNQVTTEINTRMNHMFGDLSTNYDNVASHMRQMDIQIAQTAESVKRQQGTLPGKTDKNPKECNAVQLRSGKQLSEPEKRRFTTAEKGKQKESKQLPADTPAVERHTEPSVGTSSPGPEQPAEAVRPIPEVVPPREYIPKVPYPVPTKATRKDRGEMKCRKMLEDLTVRLPLMEAIQMMPSMRSFMKGLISGKISEESEFMTYSKDQPQNNTPQMQKHQNPQPATSAPIVALQDETKVMLQLLLQGQQLQGKALNQVTTEINTRMNHMFEDLSTKYDNVTSHMRQMDIQIAQTAESVKRQQGTLPGKTNKNPKECNAVQLRSGKQLSEPEKRRFTMAEKGKQKESKQLPADTPAVERHTEPSVGTSSPGPEQPAETVRPIPEVVPPREYIPKVPYPVPTKATRKDRGEMKCRKMLEDLTVRLPLMEAIQMMPSMRSFMKGLISGKISEESEFMTYSKECSAPEKRRFTTAEKGKQKESEQLPADTPTVERNTEPAVGTSSPGPEQPAEAVCPIPEVVPPREYIPKVPYPIPAKATRKDREEMKCRKMLENLTVRLPLMDAIKMMPSMHSFMKGLISGKILEESEFMTVSKERST
ncbi:hypothetical protein F2Q70_00030763 [Brassica cretica]|uniref:Uncharacterized protein n=1 Tax=Brassica cretica TaxID=69181 RepID=A0A8S9FDZ6_BRACR|nr:hypothetical protein F2Q70_00030763 [Brassica cretica]